MKTEIKTSLQDALTALEQAAPLERSTRALLQAFDFAAQARDPVLKSTISNCVVVRSRSRRRSMIRALMSKDQSDG